MDSHTGKLAGKIALVTGATSGIGLATAKLFVAEGAYVFIAGLDQEGVDAAVGEIGRNVSGISGDISNLADIGRMYSLVREQKGRLDILFANAGGSGAFGLLENVTAEKFQRCFDVNVMGTFFTVQKGLELMVEGGAVVINGSMVSIQGISKLGVYAAGKAALRSFVRTWVAELAEKRSKIRINVVSPGTIATSLYKNCGINETGVDYIMAQAAATTPLARPGTAEEVAASVLFLVSDESRYIQGIDLFVDGGAAQI